ncbi:hypothetical protein EG329_009760 [Mollisiaceae sp. DMI_Dod_QoI]|nr:hypothetical protein EG329_009760 [Helotiales sp. DMI_Dod_QoI]
MLGPDRIHEGLPSNREIIRLFQNFKAQLHTFTPILSDINQFEKQVCDFIDQRFSLKSTNQTFNKLSILWLSLLYSILASGSQFKDVPHVQRTSESIRYLHYSFRCLSYADFLVHPTIESLETLLVLGNVLQNLMKPQAAWILLGTTSRIAQSLGIHRTSLGEPLSRDKKLWLSVIWQDSLLSLSFDRLPTTTEVPRSSERTLSGPGLTYVEAMYALLWGAGRAFSIKSNDSSYAEVLDIVNDISAIHGKTQLHLRSVEDCDTIQQRCEHHALQLHTSFVAGWFSTRAFRRNECLNDQDQARSQLAAAGKECLTRSLEAYLKLCPISLQASRSWAFIHNGLSSALVLGLIGETKTNPKVRRLQGALIDTLSNGFDNTGADRGIDGDIFLSPHHERALMALKNLFNEQTSRTQAVTERHDISSPVFPSEVPHESANTTLIASPREQLEGTINHPEESQDPAVLTDFSDIGPMEMFDSIIWDPNIDLNGLQYMNTITQPWNF